MNVPWPWPEIFLTAAEWQGARRLLERFRELTRRRALPGSLMVVGETGMGREGFVVELAALLTCHQDGPPGCGCQSCDRVRRGIHPDVVVLQQEGPGDAIKIDRVRDDLVDRLDLLPFEGARRVFVVSSLHTPPLTPEAASALLKAFEEPPAHVTIVGLAANPARTLGTISSRAIQVRVPPPSREELLALVQAHHGRMARNRAEAVIAACGDDLAASLGESAAKRGATLEAVIRTVRTMLQEDRAAVGEVAALAGSGEELLWLAVTALVREAGGTGFAEDQEFLLHCAAALLAAERKRAALRLDPVGTPLGSLAPLLLERTHLPSPPAETGRRTTKQ